MASLLNDCPTCYSQNISQCVQELVFDVGLTPDADIFAVFTDPKDNVYNIAVTVDGDGAATIDVTELPLGLFETYPNINVQFVNSIGCEPIPFTINDIDYECLTLLPMDCDSVVDSQTIPCV